MYPQHGRMPKYAAFVTEADKARLASNIYTAVDTLNKLERQRGKYRTSAFGGMTQAQVNAKNAILESEINDAYERLRRVKAQYNRQFPDNPWAPYDASPPANPTKEII